MSMGDLSDQQRERINQNFRAAKALLARKHLTLGECSASPETKRCCVSPAAKCKKPRLALAELNVNTVIQKTSQPFDEDFEAYDHSLFEEIDRLCDERKLSSTSSDLKVEGAAENAASSSGTNCASEIVPSYLQKMNETQRKAATSDIRKPLLILAGPGSGKTSTMVARVLTLLNEGVSPSNILAMTFTTAAAAEMRDRVGAVVGKTLSKELSVSTFHSFCLQLCRLHAEKLNRTTEFLIYGTSQQRRAVVEATRLASEEQPQDAVAKGELNAELWRDRAKKWQQFVTQAKASGKSADELEKGGNVFGAVVLRHYDRILESCNALDYHDFISFAVKLLSDHPDVLEHCHSSWPFILVDEFQDTSAMQYKFLRLLSSHNCITVVGDDDQSIFSFNGADSLGFNLFRNDFPEHTEVRLNQNYRSTRCIVEAAKCLIQNNFERCRNKHIVTDNVLGDKIVVRECRNEDAQCAFVVDSIVQNAASDSNKPDFSNFAVLYRRQVTGRLFQLAFRSRKIPFNVHGVAFYRKKVIKSVIALLWTSVEKSSDTFTRRVFKAFYGGDKLDTRKAVEYVEKHSNANSCTFLESAETIFRSKISGTFNRRQLSQGRKVLSTMELVQQLVTKERSLSSLITAVVNILPQRAAFDTRAVVDETGGKLLNEDDDPRTVLHFLLDDVSDFLSNQTRLPEQLQQTGCGTLLQEFLSHLAIREAENFRARRHDNQNSVTLTTMHQSKGLEWDTVFIVQANEMETPLLNAVGVEGNPASLEEERRLFYVAMTRARKKLFISYSMVSPQRQVLQPSRFIKELPSDLLQFEALYDLTECIAAGQVEKNQDNQEIVRGASEPPSVILNASAFLRSFNIEARSTVSSIFHMWAKKSAFQDPKRLLNKVGFVIDERLRSKAVRNKDVLHALRCSLGDAEALLFADQVIQWEKLPLHERAVFQAERNEHFQQKCSERTMSQAAATPKQSLGCTTVPSSRLHASKLIEQYKAL